MPVELGKSWRSATLCGRPWIDTGEDATGQGSREGGPGGIPEASGALPTPFKGSLELLPGSLDAPFKPKHGSPAGGSVPRDR